MAQAAAGHFPSAAPPGRALALGGRPRTLDVSGPLPLPLQMVRAWQRSRARAEGALSAAQESALGPLEAVWRGVRADPRRLAHYRAACRHPDTGSLPGAWIETLFLPPMSAIALSDDFPLSPLGLIHTGQRITLHRPVGAGETVDAVARLATVRETTRGIELEIALELRCGADVPWQGLATLLSRNRATRSRSSRSTDAAGAGVVADDPGWQVEDIEASADLGRRYARASGDWNPHHLWPLSARAVGYPRPIAHGMWTLGRTLAALDDRLVTPWTADAAFKRPVFLPGRVSLRWRDRDGGIDFEVRDARSAEPHLVGRAAAA